MKFWDRYRSKVTRACAGSDDVKDIDYWRNNLFAGTVIYLLPFCLIALLPGVYFSIVTGKYILAVVDLLTAVGILLVAFMPGLSMVARKLVFFSLLTVLSCTLLIDLGLSGPGLLYLLATCTFSLLILPTRYAYAPAWVIAGICIVFALVIFLDVIPGPRRTVESTGEWIAVSSNLVFLAFLLAALIPTHFKGVQDILNKEKELKETLRKQQDLLQEALHQVRQKNDELEQFAYVASHDLQEPLRMITSFMGMLKNKYGDKLDERAHTYINFAVDGGKRMQKMISDLLELSRTGHNDDAKQITDLRDILNEVEQNICKLIDETNTKIIIENPLPSLPVYRGDISRLFQNLLTNAIKFRKKDGNAVIRVSSIEQKDSWLIRVEDNGIGIEKDQCEKIFEIFSRLHVEDVYPGSGIGLAVCKKVVEQHGGIIRVESQEGKGSTFYFSIEK